jgi:hypothetical protein
MSDIRISNEINEQPKLPKAVRQGKLTIAGFDIRCYVLDNSTTDRVLSRQDLLVALGRSANPTSRAVSNEAPSTPNFLSASNLKQFVTDDLLKSIQPVVFTSLKWHKTIGYTADVIKDICYVFIDAAKAGVLKPNQLHIAERCELLVRGFASVGVRALVDEATGFQEIRPRDDLQRYLDTFLLKEYSKWVKRFPEEFFEGFFRMKGWTWNEASTKRPVIVGTYINDFVYQRLAPYILEELRNKNPVSESGHRKAKHHQWLTPDIGHPKLQEHLQGVMAIQRIAGDNWRKFKEMMDKAFPRYGHTLAITFAEENELAHPETAAEVIPGLSFNEQLKALLAAPPLRGELLQKKKLV